MDLPLLDIGFPIAFVGLHSTASCNILKVICLYIFVVSIPGLSCPNGPRSGALTFALRFANYLIGIPKNLKAVYLDDARRPLSSR